MQTDKLSKKIGVILYGREYWEQVLDLKPMAEWGAIAEKDLELLHYADTPADAFEQLRDHLDRAPHRAGQAGARRQAAITPGDRQDAGIARSTQTLCDHCALAVDREHAWTQRRETADRSVQRRLPGGR